MATVNKFKFKTKCSTMTFPLDLMKPTPFLHLLSLKTTNLKSLLHHQHLHLKLCHLNPSLHNNHKHLRQPLKQVAKLPWLDHQLLPNLLRCQQCQHKDQNMYQRIAHQFQILIGLATDVLVESVIFLKVGYVPHLKFKVVRMHSVLPNSYIKYQDYILVCNVMGLLKWSVAIAVSALKDTRDQKQEYAK